MATQVETFPPAGIAQRPSLPRLVDDVRFDWAFIALCCWVMLGMAADAWAHSHGKVDVSFFTPYHALLYTGVTAAILFVALTLVVNWQRGYRGWALLPAGYKLTIVGLLLFGLGGFGDMIWHTLFGIEQDLEAIISPTHLMLAVALGLTVTGPVRAAWHRPERSPSNPFPLLLALTFTWSAFSFLTVYIHPFVYVHPLSTNESTMQLGMAGVLLQSAILMGLVLLSVRRWQLPLGSFMLMFTLNGLILTAISDEFRLLLPVAAAGLGADLMNHYWQPRSRQGWRLRLFAFTVPALLYLLFFLTLMLTGGIAWVIHVWAGSIVLAGIVGWIGSYLIWPPPIPAIADEPSQR